MAYKPAHFSMRRIVLIAVIAIILPSLVLTLVGLKLTLDLKSQLEQSLAEQYATAVGTKVEEIETQIRDLEALAKLKADKLRPEQVVPALDALRRGDFIEDVFLLRIETLASGVAVEQRLRLVYPEEPESRPAAPEALLWDEPSVPVPRAASPDETVEALRRYRDQALSPPARARATQIIAATLFRHGRYADAIAEYRRLIEVDQVAVFSPSLAVLARYQIALAERKLQRARDALDALLALYEDLVHGRTGVGDAGRVAYFKQRIREDVQALLAARTASRLVRQRFEDLLQAEREREARVEFLAYVRRFVLPRLALQVRTLRPGEEEFRRLWDDEFAREPYLVAYTAIRAHDGERRILGLRLGLRHIRTKLLDDALASSRFGARVAFVVVDSRGEAVYGEPGKAGFAAAKDFGLLKSWRLGLVEREPAELRRLALYNVLLFTIVNGLMIVAIIIGVVITLRGTAHELELSELKSDFVSNVSHELKTPLALIRMFAETLELGRVKSPEKVREYYSIITRESERLTQLINNVLDFSRIERGRKTYDLRLDDLADVVRDTLHAYSFELTKQSFEVEADVADDLPETLLDRNAISLALLNLLSNAVKYSADDRRIRVACAARNGALVLEVADHGIGIDEPDLEKIFDKFYRARDEAVRATRGSGLGLAIVRHSIEAHGGTIAVRSTKGQGSTFTVTLPIRKTLTNGKNPGR